MPRKHSPPLRSFSPKLFEFWRLGLKQRLICTFDTSAEATRLKHRLYACRAAMQNENHPDADSAARVTIRQREKDGKHLIVCEPVDSEFDDALAAAGVIEEAAPPLPENLYEINPEEISHKKAEDK